MKKMNRKGFTLVEVMTVLAIVGIVLTMIFSLLFYGFDVFNMTSAEYQVQSGTRLALQQTDKLVRYSTAIFAVPDTTYMDPEWNYIGMNEDRTEIINYKWDSTSQTHIEEIMAGPYPDVTFNIGFTKQNNLSTDNSLKLYFETYAADGTTKRYNIVSGYEALNALQVINYGTVSHPATALAYRDETASYENYKVIVNIALVLDTSGSMASAINGNNATTSNPSRISILRTQVAALVDNFASNTNSDVSINISLVPFATYSPTPSSFYDIKNTTQKTNLKTAISNLGANGYTNTGDGLRRAYYQLLTKSTADASSATIDTIIKNYTIILVDGDSNTHSMSNTKTITQVCTRYNKDGSCRTYKSTTSWTQEYYSSSDTIDNCTFTPTQTTCTPGYVTNTSNSSLADNYVALMGANLSDPDFTSNYVISFARDTTPSQIVFIADSTNTPNDADHIYAATSADELGLSFTQIQMSITNELWRFLGPKLAETN
ncbi:MAG: VWA domain-containing protein [Erysipelotrichaceae bacterium]|nr:VWA domain-containing protein [Erysipelotrichaceae bacterium]